MHVLHVAKYFPPYKGGMETCLRDMLTSMARAGVESTALVHQSRAGLKTSFEVFGTGEHRSIIVRAGIWFRLIFAPISPLFPWYLLRTIRRERPSIVHIHMPSPSAFWLLMLPGTGSAPWVVHWHADAIDNSAGLLYRQVYRFIYLPLQNWLLHRAHKIIVTSQSYLDSSEALRDHLEKCRVIPLGLDPDQLHQAIEGVRPSKRLTSKLQVLAVGRMSYYKGLDYLLRAAAQIPTVELHMVGDGDQAEDLRKLCNKLGLQDRVIFHGNLSDKELARQYMACDCLCLPSTERAEAFGLVQLEAMSFGKAVVASDIPGSGIGTVVDNHITGIKVKPRNEQDLAKALNTLAEDRELCQSMGKAGRSRFENYFHIDRNVQATLELYREVLGRAW